MLRSHTHARSISTISDYHKKLLHTRPILMKRWKNFILSLLSFENFAIKIPCTVKKFRWSNFHWITFTYFGTITFCLSDSKYWNLHRSLFRIAVTSKENSTKINGIWYLQSFYSTFATCMKRWNYFFFHHTIWPANSTPKSINETFLSSLICAQMWIEHVTCVKHMKRENYPTGMQIKVDTHDFKLLCYKLQFLHCDTSCQFVTEWKRKFTHCNVLSGRSFVKKVTLYN